MKALPSFALLAVLFLCTTAQADRIILRNLEVISDQQVAAFDEDGVRMSGGRTLTWDEIERGSVAEAQQERFDRYLKDLGEPLYRIRQRLKVEDYQSLVSHAEAVAPRYAGRNSPTAYMVHQALMWGLLAVGRREEAIEPYLRCFEYLRNRRQNVDLPGNRRLQYDADTGLSSELAPVWFDAQAAEKALPGVYDAVGKMRRPTPPATRIYFATLASMAGHSDRARQVLKGVDGSDRTMADFRDAALAQDEVLRGTPGAAVESLERRAGAVSPAARPLAFYWIGKAKILADDASQKRAGLLSLLRLPAAYSDQTELAAAGLYEAIGTLNRLGNAEGAAALRRELLSNYGQTYYGAKIKQELTQGQDSR